MKRNFFKAAALLMALTMLTSCNKQPSTNPGTGADPNAKNEFIYVSGTEPTTLDPQFITDVNTARASVQIYETLVSADEKGNIVPVLAESWTTSDDNLTWTFKLRSGVKFHDGEPFNAEAVKFNIERMLSPETASPRQSTADMISKVEVVGELEVAISTDYPYGPFLAQIGNYNMGIMSPKAAKEGGKGFGHTPVGTGALKLESWDPGRAIVMTKFDEYWGEKSTVDKLSFKFVAEDASRVMMLKTGDADVISAIPPIQVEDLKSDKNVTVDLVTGFRTIYLGMNTSKKPLNDVKVRQAINYAIDKDSIIDNLLRGLATYPSGIESTVITYSAQDLNPYKHNIEKAKQLLAEAGYPDGFKTTIHTPEGRYAMDRQVAEVIQAMLKTVGIEATITVLDWGAYQEATTKGDVTNLFLLGKGSPTGDPDYTLTLCYGTKKGMNNTMYSSPVIDKMLDEQRQTTDQAKRNQILYDIQKTIHDDAPHASLYYEMQIFGRRSNVSGFVVYPNEMINFKYLTRN